MTTEPPNVAGIQAISFDDMQFDVGPFHYKNADAWVFHAWDYAAHINPHTVVCLMPRQVGVKDALIAYVIVDGRMGPAVGYLETHRIPEEAFEFMAGSLYNVVEDKEKVVTAQVALQYKGVHKLHYIGAVYRRGYTM